jgi:hypothetical protein
LAAGFLTCADVYRRDSWAARLRRQRHERFLQLVQGLPAPVRVLDVGGTVDFWQANGLVDDPGFHFTLVNLTVQPTAGAGNIETVAGDARDLKEFGDGSFDVCFSNSVIEHVGTLFDQMAMAAEVRRVAKAYFIQTPNRHFCIEPHFHFPFWQFLPASWRASLLQRRSFGWMPREPDYLSARAQVEQIRLVSGREMRLLFPDGTVEYERVGPLVKSLIAIRPARTS